MKRLPVLIFTLLALSLPGRLRADAILSVGASSGVLAPGSTFTIPVQISNVADLFAFQFDFSYDPAVLQLSSITEGPFLPSAGTTFFIPGVIDNSLGIASFNGDTLLGFGLGAFGTGDLADFTFTVASPGSSLLTLSNIILLDSNLADIPTTAVPSTVAVAPEPGTISLLGTGLLCLLPWMKKRRSDRSDVYAEAGPISRPGDMI